MASTRHAAKIFISAEASDLCPREHELGTFGTPRLAAFVDGHLRGQSEGQPSFPRPRWQPFSVTVELTSELLLVVLESDPLQPRPGAPFCYGFLRLREELGPLAWQQKIHISRPLEEAPGRYGSLSIELSVDEPRPEPPAPGGKVLSLANAIAHPVDWCGVLRFSPELGLGRWSLEAAAGPPQAPGPDQDGLSPSSGFISWVAESKEALACPEMKELFVVERDVVFSAHASLGDKAGKCMKRLSRMRGAGGMCNMFVDAHPDPLAFEMAGVKHPPRMHLRFFPAEFLRPKPGMPCGLSIRITLAAVPPGLDLPLVFYVPAGCFSEYAQEQSHASFCISHIGDCAEICLSDPSRLIGRALWRVSANFSSERTRGLDLTRLLTVPDAFIDVLALRLRPVDEKVLTIPVDEHAIVLRVLPSTLRVDVPRPVFGLFLPPADTADDLRMMSPGGEVAGIFVHSLAVHSPHVRCCLISAGPDPGTLFYPLPHMGGKVFIPAQPDHHGKVIAHAFLPDFGYHAVAEATVSDFALQLRWLFNEGSGHKTTVLAAALITFARWPLADGISAIGLRVMRNSVPAEASSLLTPLSIGMDEGDAFTWYGRDGDDHEAILSVGSAGAGMEVQCGECITSSFLLPDLLLAQSALGFSYELDGAPDLEKGQEQEHADGDQKSYSEELSKAKKMVFDETQGILVPAADSDDSQGTSDEKDARRARHLSSPPRRLRREAVTTSAALCLPVLVEERQDDKSAMAFCFLPVRVQHVSERPQLQFGADAALRRLTKGSPNATGVILLQKFSSFARLEAHSDGSCQGCWEPVPALSLTVTGFSGVAARASARTAAHSSRGCAATWSPPVSGDKESPPHIIKMRFATQEDACLEVQIEFRFSCPACSEAATFTACGQVHMTALWQPIDVHLNIRKNQGLISAGHLGTAFARLMLCPSQLCGPQPGLLTLELKPVFPGGPGVSELLDLETNAVRSGWHGSAVTEIPAGLRLAVDKEGGPALVLDGRPEDFSAAGRRRCQLCVEIGPEDALRSVTLELQALTGSRRLLRSLLLAALGPLGDTAVVAYHIHFGPRCSLALLCSFEARRHVLQVRQVKARPTMPLSLEVTQEDTAKEEQNRRLSDALLQLQADKPSWRPPKKPRPASASPAHKRSPKMSHPFLERGPHHWLTEKLPVHKKTGHIWTQEMGRQQPVSATPRRARSKKDAPGPYPRQVRYPIGWDEKAEAKDGPKYRSDFLCRQKAKIFHLREDIARCRAAKERVDQRLNQMRRALRSAQKELEPKHSHSRSEKQSGSDLGSQQVCANCEKPIPPEGRFCSGCFPQVVEEALQLREIVGKQLVEAAALRHQLESQKREETQLEARKCDLEAQLYAVEAGAQDSQTEPTHHILKALAQLRTLRRDEEVRSRLAAEQLEALSQREAASIGALEEATVRLQQANERHGSLQERLLHGDKKVKALLAEISQLATGKGDRSVNFDDSHRQPTLAPSGEARISCSDARPPALK
ncbi:unnamed protein product [Durusdinium trenchii]|uniref:Uncharacterized protein n=1 Tax=Durusdinium trenchii TaxID=1381693 RepID=A0ABP0JQ91_9DINO